MFQCSWCGELVVSFLPSFSYLKNVLRKNSLLSSLTALLKRKKKFKKFLCLLYFKIILWLFFMLMMHIVLNIIISLQHHLSQLHDSHSKPETKTPPQLRHEHYQSWWHEVIVRDEDGVQKWYLNHISSIESFRFMSQSTENVEKLL